MPFFLPLLGLIGAGASLYGQNKSAKAQERAGQYNATIARANAKFDLEAELAAIAGDSLLADMQYAEAQSAYRLSKLEAKMRAEDADRLRLFAEARTDASREEIRRQRLANERFSGSQRARIGASGVIEEGSPLELLAETAGKMELALEEMHRQANYDRSAAYDEAGQIERESGVASILADAELDGAAFRRSSTLRALETDRNSALNRYVSTNAAANLGVATASAQAAATRLSSAGTLLSGVGTWASQRNTAKYQGMN